MLGTYFYIQYDYHIFIYLGISADMILPWNTLKKTVCLDCHGNVKFKAMVLKLI